MLRCVLASFLLLLAGLVQAQGQLPRSFPATALRGEIAVQQPPEILLNGMPARLSPGSRIRGTNNMLVMSASIAGQPLLVHYTLDNLGQVHMVWVLTEAELARRPWPVTPAQAKAWSFDPSAQTWTRP